MALFSRGEVYTIVTDMETNFWVQKFAENHCIEHTTIDVMKADDLIVISFRSKERRASIYRKLKGTFKSIYNVKMGEYLTFITKNKES